MARKWIPGMLDFGQYVIHPPLMRSGLSMLRGLFRLGRLPGVKSVHPWMRESKTQMFWIPVNAELSPDPSVPLPRDVVDYFIDKSETRVVMDFCGCRAAYECEDYPSEVGCLMMGPDAAKIPGRISRRVSRDEARAHVQKAMDAGLPPFVGKARIDNFIFGVPDNGRLLTVCFCCDCCCITDVLKNLDPLERKSIVHRLEGLEVTVDTEACAGCGKCADHCFVDAIALSEKKAVITDDCLGCGRCALYCPKEAITITLDNPDFVGAAVKSIEEYVEV